MTRNVYVGAEIESVLAAADPTQVPRLVAESYAAVRATDFAERAAALAGEIEAARPHLVGLQEVSVVRVRDPGDSPEGHPAAAADARLDYLDILLEALEARGLDYRVAARVDNFDFEVPMLSDAGLKDVRLTDHDVILARSDVATAGAGAGTFAAVRRVTVGDTTLEIRRGWAAVDATVAGRTYRFVNTHLEPADVEPGIVVPELEAVQLAQAAELLAGLDDAEHPVVLVGDLNSAADGSTTATYAAVLEAGFVDAWALGGVGDGHTACQAADLRDPDSRLSQRIDFVLYADEDTRAGRDFAGTVRAERVGDEPAKRTPSGLWPSDHAGVVARFSLDSTWTGRPSAAHLDRRRSLPSHSGSPRLRRRMGDMLSKLAELLSELRRRRIFQVLAGYAAAAFIIAQVAALAVPALHLPDGVLTVVVLLAILGFPLAAVLAWAFEVTPEGVRRTPAFQADEAEGRAERIARNAFLAGTLLLTAALGWAAWALWLKPAGVEPVVAAEETSFDPTRIAVLYFDAFGPEEELRYFADGLTEGLIDRLARVDLLDVKSRTAVKPYREGTATQDSIVRALEVGSLVEGSVQRSGDLVRATVQLIDGATGDHLESTELQRTWEDRLDLRDEISLAAADMIRRKLGVEVQLRERKRETESVEAWTLVHRAERLRDDAERLFEAGDSTAAGRVTGTADSLLAAAEAEDGEWTEPIVLRGWLAIDRARRAGPTLDTRDPAWYRRAIEHAGRALALDPGNAQALELRGTARFGLSAVRGTERSDALRGEAESDLRAAVAAEPSLARAWAELGEVLRRDSRLAEAKWAAERALEEDAFLANARGVIARLYQTSIDLQDFDEAIRWCENGRRRFPEWRYFVACSLFSMALEGGVPPDLDQAWELHEELASKSPAARRNASELTGRMLVAAVAARSATSAEEGPPPGSAGATELADSARALATRARDYADESLEPWADYYEANVHLLLGDADAALRLLAEHLEALPDRRENIASDWMFRPLWQDERFRRLTSPGRAQTSPNPR